MARFTMEDGSVVNTAKATKSWKEDTKWDGNNHISIPTGSQWEHETLYLSNKGRYYIVRTSQWQGSTPTALFLTHEEAAAWLLVNGHELPDDLAEAGRAVEE